MAIKHKYTNLATVQIHDTRNLVISAVDDGAKGFTIAQQLSVQEGNRNTTVFLKGGIHIDSIKSLTNFRDALNVAISKFNAGHVKTYEECCEEEAESYWD